MEEIEQLEKTFREAFQNIELELQRIKMRKQKEQTPTDWEQYRRRLY